ncbi:MAG: DinB family protein [Gemmatimonadota bacterium]
MMPTSGTFPDIYESLDTARLLAAFEAGPAIIRGLVQRLDDAALDARPIDGKWSIRQIAVHVVDSELVGAVRFRMVLAEPGGALPFYDQDVWARELRYQEADERALAGHLALFAALRERSIGILRGLDEGDWRKRGVHAEHGSVTLRQLLELYADHSERHAQQIVERRRLLGIETSHTALLPERLY